MPLTFEIIFAIVCLIGGLLMMVCCQPFWWLMKKKECPKMKWLMRGKKLRVTVARSSDMVLS